MTFTEIHRRLSDEEDPARRRRLEQFVVEVVRNLPTYPVDQAALVALQVSDVVDIHRCEDLTQVIQRAWRLPVYPESEWRMLGHRPMTTATPLRFETPRESPAAGEPTTEAHYIDRDMLRTPGVGESTGSLPRPLRSATGDAVQGWSRRVVHDAGAADIYADLQAELPAHSVAMLGNLWKIGAVAEWAEGLGSATSRQRVNPAAVSRIPTGPALPHRDAWYLLELNRQLGPEVFAEICLCVASILSGYSPQVWENPYVIRRRGPMRIIECEAAGYIAGGRLGGPRRRTCTEWFRLHSGNDEPLPGEFRWDLVLHTAARVEDLLRGDTEPVWMEAEAALGGD